MPDGSDRKLLASEIEVSSRVPQRLEYALDRLVERGKLTSENVKRILGALDTLPPEAAKRILAEVTGCIGNPGGLTPLVDKILNSNADPAFVADPTSEPEPESPTHHQHGKIEDCHE